jgi:transposase
MEVELSPGVDACADCGGRLRRIGEDVTEELEYFPGRCQAAPCHHSSAGAA